MAVRVLVVEDEPDLAETLERGLRREGYAVDRAEDGPAAWDKLVATAYDLVCLDLTLPGLDGRELARRLRAFEPRLGRAPARILMLTARDGVRDRVAGLDDGADDYLTKPFAFVELTARVRALLRRDAGRTGAALRAGPVELNTAAHAASVDGRPLRLTVKEFALLRFFMAAPGQVFSRAQLLDHVWDEAVNPDSNTVPVTVANLRRKLRDAGGDGLVETVPGFGYRLRP